MPLVTYSQVLSIKIRIFSFEEEEDFIQSPQCPSWMHAVTTVWAKALQSCPILCSPMDYSLPGSSVHGILQAKYWRGLPCPPPGELPDPGRMCAVTTVPFPLRRCSRGEGGWAHLFWFLPSVCCVNTCLANPFFYPGHLFHSFQPNVTIYNLSS